MPTAKELFDYANRYARKREAAGQGTVNPKFRVVARRFKCSQQAIETAIEDSDFREGYLGIVVGFQCGGGVADYEGGDREVEAYV